MLHSVQIELLLVDIMIYFCFCKYSQFIQTACPFFIHHPYLHLFPFPGSLGWVTTFAHKNRSLCGRKNHGTSFPRQVHYIGFSDDEVEHGGKQKRDHSRCLKIMAPSFWFINLSFVGAYFDIPSNIDWNCVMTYACFQILLLIIFVDLGGGRATEGPARYFLHIWLASFSNVLADRGSMFMKMLTGRCNCCLTVKSCVKLCQIVCKKVLISCGQRVFLTWMGRVLGTLKILTISEINRKGDFHRNHYPTTPWCGQSLGAQSQDEWLPLTHFRLQEFFHARVGKHRTMMGNPSEKNIPPQCQVPAVPAPKNQSNRGRLLKNHDWGL